MGKVTASGSSLDHGVLHDELGAPTPTGLLAVLCVIEVLAD